MYGCNVSFPFFFFSSPRLGISHTDTAALFVAVVVFVYILVLSILINVSGVMSSGIKQISIKLSLSFNIPYLLLAKYPKFTPWFFLHCSSPTVCGETTRPDCSPGSNSDISL